MNFIKRYRKKQEIKNIYRNIIIKSLDEHTGGIDNELKDRLMNKIEMTIFDDTYTSLLENFSLYYKKGIFELSIPYLDMFDVIEKNIEIYYKIVDISHNKYNRWMVVQFI